MASIVVMPAISAPATNAFGPAPVSTTTRTPGSASAARKASVSAAMVAASSALSLSGRLTVMRRTTPSSATKTELSAMRHALFVKNW
ncbi:hypothetical protein QE383_001849 [Pseudoxanthomonas winnipegensis]|uniref:Uncharacterized protein n=1 Tax=Pseudoxanthomonas winnipegensis TaxID=2480810 RepID=A0AAW8GAT5_9GAMM|nr:hypothetical protein [Pseudoxanthomonas winnipegensis]